MFRGIRFYREARLSGLFSTLGLIESGCRFYPTCSRYMEEAVVRHGFYRGIRLGLQRMLRCHPLQQPGGWDPVIETK
ncbi:MAG: membrane protein insertion efficiency factor YidD [Candidatus Omnitrophica bacterium]|nr:membrane protein insertion efficiency factor YidD [Candidatus Omnitrophota bacterium]